MSADRLPVCNSAHLLQPMYESATPKRWLVLGLLLAAIAIYGAYKGGRHPLNPPIDALIVKSHMTKAQLQSGNPITNSIGMILVPIPAGEFMMGAPNSDDDAVDADKPQHRVRLTKPFYIQATEVTRQQWLTVMGSRPWRPIEEYLLDVPMIGTPIESDDVAAEGITWSDAVEFCRELSDKEGVTYRLPTEAEWEFCCRAGTTTRYSFGDDTGLLNDYAWWGGLVLFDESSAAGEVYPHRVARKSPNAWALFDMHGNVSEWCADALDLEAYHSRGEITLDPFVKEAPGDILGLARVLRGGSVGNETHELRSDYRMGWEPDLSFPHRCGFRVVREFE